MGRIRRRFRWVGFAAALALAGATRCLAPPPLVTGDVPTAAQDSFEYYLGLRYQESGSISRQVPFSELVYGCTDHTEVVIELPLVSRNSEFGAGDAVVGFKTIVQPETARGPGAAFSYEASVPSGDDERGLGVGAWQHELRLRAQKTWGWFTPIANLGYTFVGEPTIGVVRRPRRDTWRASLAQEWQVSPRTKLLSELYYRSSDESGGAHVLAANVGFKRRVRENLAIHAAIGRSVRGDARGGPDLRLYAGVKWEFAAPRSWRKHAP